MIDSITESAGAGVDLKKPRRQKTSHQRDVATIDRLPPHSNEAEQGVLGCILLSPAENMGECIDKITVEAFYDLRHQTIYQALYEMYDKRQGIDLITLHENLKDKQLIEQIGGIVYLSELQDKVPSAANLQFYLDHVREKFLLRRMIQVCTKVVGDIYDYRGEVDALLDEVEKEVLRVNESRAQTTITPVNTLVHNAIETIENYFGRNGQLGGIATGFIDLDKMTDGLHGGEMIVIAARPSMGKTSLAMNIAEHAALEGLWTEETDDERKVAEARERGLKIEILENGQWRQN